MEWNGGCKVSVLRRVLDYALTALFIVVMVAVVALVVPRLVGVSAFSVLSGSMEPLYPTGSVVYVNTKIDVGELTQGDVITFMIDKNTVATHRIVDVVPGDDGVTRFQTKGDANDQPDSKLVHPGNVLGTPVFCVPYVGYVVGWVQQPPGAYLAVCAAAIVVFLMFLPDLFPSRKRDEEDEGEGSEGRELEDGGKPEQEAHEGFVAPADLADDSVGKAEAQAPNACSEPEPSARSAEHVVPLQIRSSASSDDELGDFEEDRELIGRHGRPYGRHAGTDKTQRAGKHARVSDSPLT